MLNRKKYVSSFVFSFIFCIRARVHFIYVYYSYTFALYRFFMFLIEKSKKIAAYLKNSCIFEPSNSNKIINL